MVRTEERYEVELMLSNAQISDGLVTMRPARVARQTRSP
jgi:hypothetical protein